MKNSIDLKIRIFILDLLTNRRMTFTEIKKSIARDYHDQEYLRQEIRDLLWTLQSNNLILREIVEKSERTDNCRYSYTTSERGQERLDYYIKKQESGEETNVS